MPFLGLDYSPPTVVESLVQQDRIAMAKISAEMTPWKSLMRGLGSFYDELSGLGGLGAPPVQGTRAWWTWYATSYLPQFYTPTQIQQYVVASPYYQQFGSPFAYGFPQYNQPYPASYNPYTQPVNVYSNAPYQYANYPYYGYGSQSYNPYAPAQYNQYYGDQGPANCAIQGGYWDYGQNVCNAVTGQPPYGNTVYGPNSSPPNVIGMPKWAAVAALNGAGFNVWLLNENGISQGTPPGYSQNRVDISVQNGTVTAAAVG